jgi:hypothetical protein
MMPMKQARVGLALPSPKRASASLHVQRSNGSAAPLMTAAKRGPLVAVCLAAACSLSACSTTLCKTATCPSSERSSSSEPHMSSQVIEPSLAQVEMAFAEGQSVQLRANIHYDASLGTWTVDYRLRNASATASVAVFDRGDAHEVGIGRQTLGAIGIPRSTTTDAGDLEIVHAARPLPNPSPVSPPTPLAIELTAGAEVSGQFSFSSLFAGAPKRVRWCVGVMLLQDADKHLVYETAQGRILQTGFGVVDRQRMLCTPWYDIASRAFER